MTAIAEIGAGQRGLASGRLTSADDGRGHASAPAVTNLPAKRRIDEGILEDVVDRATVAAHERCDVGFLSALTGRCDVVQPNGRDGYWQALSACTILVSGLVLHPSTAQPDGRERAEKIANQTCSTTRESQAFLDLACMRAEALAGNPKFWEMRGLLRQRLLDCGGAADLNFKPSSLRTSPLVELSPQIVVNVPQQPPPVVNIVSPQPEAPAVNVNVPPPADKHIVFDRNYEGAIVSATSEAV